MCRSNDTENYYDTKILAIVTLKYSNSCYLVMVESLAAFSSL